MRPGWPGKKCSRPEMRFLADMGVSLRVADWLRAQGHDVVHLREQGLQRLPNGEIFRKADSEHRIVLTFDLDFAEILALSGSATVSTVIFRLQNPRAEQVIERLRRVLETSGESLNQGAVVIVEQNRHRVRELPIGVGGTDKPLSP